MSITLKTLGDEVMNGKRLIADEETINAIETLFTQSLPITTYIIQHLDDGKRALSAGKERIEIDESVLLPLSEDITYDNVVVTI